MEEEMRYQDEKEIERARGAVGPTLVDGLQTEISGEVIAPWDDGYDRARALWNGTVDKRPALIVRCRSTRDVSACLRAARDAGLPAAVRGGGHNVAGNALVEGGLVIDLSPMHEVAVDTSARTAKIQGGATLGHVDRATYAHGLATPSGVVSETGYAGLTLHGGMGWQLRKRGLAADNVLAAAVLTADGQLHTASATNNPDLLWAIKGGGGPAPGRRRPDQRADRPAAAREPPDRGHAREPHPPPPRLPQPHRSRAPRR
jgi:FAD/FMN-containing dehydrogenase